MRKNNWLVLAVSLVVSVLLLAVWFALGFSRVDSPLDMIITAGWWIVVAVVISAIVWAERRRRQQMLTVFVGNGVVYNPEVGVVRVHEDESEVELMRNILAGLKFNDDVARLAGASRSTFRWIVHTHRFENNGAIWVGEAIPIRTPGASPRPFNSQEDLTKLLLGE